MRVTLKQIAEISGVARSTVDKVLNNRPGVSDEVRARVQSIADELGYQTNIIGKALAFQKKPLQIAVVAPKNDFTEAAMVGIDRAYDEIKDFGIKIDYYLSKDYDVAEQINTLNYLINKKVAGIILRPVEGSAIRPVIDSAAEQNIPVITFNSDVIGSKRMCFVGQDLYTAGRVAGNLLAKLLQGHGTVAVITGSKALSALQLRLDGFKSIIDNNWPRIMIEEIVETHEDKIITFQSTLDLLDKYPNLDGLYVTYGTLAEVGKALKLKKMAGKIKVVCFDFYPEVIKLIKEDIVDFAIGQDPIAQGYKPVKIMFDYLFNNKKPETDFINTTIDIKEKESINSID